MIFALLRDSVILNFDKIIFPAKNFDETATSLARFLEAIVKQVLGYERREAARKTEQAVGVFG